MNFCVAYALYPMSTTYNHCNDVCSLGVVSCDYTSRSPRKYNEMIFVGTAVSGTHIVIVQSLSISLSHGSSFEFVLRNSDTRNMSETVDKSPFGHYSFTQRLRNRVHFSIIEDVFDNPREVLSSEQGLCSLL